MEALVLGASALIEDAGGNLCRPQPVLDNGVAVLDATAAVGEDEAKVLSYMGSAGRPGSVMGRIALAARRLVGR